ncbi:hypothetical protein HHI36_012148 [Cryptolaemus montrouzieri]|uniref:RING-type E3 ubiquitin transferase n=1 Tax=Cryptolaemus montrouzieri TaxID=559131 RepID=A0ABD2NDQ0_9CUCU
MMNSTPQFRKRRSPQVNSKCYFFERGCCRFGNRCRYRHDISTKATEIWNKQRLNSKELAERSKGKNCGICFEEVISKKKGLNKFGILPNCKHCFCFSCIKIWRNSVHFEHEVTKSCPECRINSNYVYKNSYWVEDEYKDKFIAERNRKLGNIECKYFRRGRGVCRLGNKCLFRHDQEISHFQSSRAACVSHDDDDNSSAIIRLMLFENSLTDDEYIFDPDDWISDSDELDDDDLETFYLLSEIL